MNLKLTKRTIMMVILASLVLMMFSFTVIADEAEYTITHVMNERPSAHHGPETFKDYVESVSDGKIKVDLVLRATLGGERDIIELLQLGEIEMTSSMTEGAIAGQVPAIELLNMPFLISDAMVAQKLVEGPYFDEVMAPMVLEGTNEQIKLLGATKNSYRHSYFTEPVRTPSDLKDTGITMRTMEAPIHIELWEALGASVITLPGTERYNAMQTGMIDGLEGGLVSVYDVGIMEIADYVTLTGHQFSFLLWGVNNDWFTSLPRDIQEIIAEGTAKATWTHFGRATHDSVKTLETMRAEGVEILALTPAEREQWREIAEPVAREFLSEQHGEEQLDRLIDAVAEAEEKVNRIKYRVID